MDLSSHRKLRLVLLAASALVITACAAPAPLQRPAVVVAEPPTPPVVEKYPAEPPPPAQAPQIRPEAPAPAPASRSARPAAAANPLSVEDIEYYLKNKVSSKLIVSRIAQRGVSFVLNDRIRKRLKKAQADARILKAIAEANSRNKVEGAPEG